MRQKRKTDDNHIAGVRRIEAEPEDIARAIFDMAIQTSKDDSGDKDDEEKDADD